MTVTRHSEITPASSQRVVANSTQSLVEQQNHSESISSSNENGEGGFTSNNVESVGVRAIGTQKVSSLIPGRAQLNADTTNYSVDGAFKEALDALAVSNKARLRADIPTADYVRRSGFKVGSKLLIKVAPTAKSTKLENNIPNLIFDKFSLQGVAEPDEERYQLHETFESEILFLFGRRPRVWTLQGIVVNGRRPPARDPDYPVEGSPTAEQKAAETKRLAKDMDIANTLLQDWEDFYRGSKAVELRARTYISYEDSVIEGTLLGLTVVRNAQIPSAANVTLTFVVHQRAFLGQEYREGITAPNLADLIEKTNAAGGSADKVKPSEIQEAKPTQEEVARREGAATEELTENEQKTRDLLEEKAALEATIAQEESIINTATVESISAEEAFAVAEADRLTAEAHGDTAGADDAQERADAAGFDIAAAATKETEARKRKQAAEARSREIGDEVSGAVAAEDNSKAKRDGYTAAKDKSSS